MEGKFKFEVALSFAGEDRNIARQIAIALRNHGVSVFYDEFYRHELWGKKLSTYFIETYGPNTRFVIPLISKYYPIKDWTNFEFGIARDEANKRKIEFILPIRLDNTIIVGIQNDIGYLDYHKIGVEGITETVLNKINISSKQISKENFIRKHIPKFIKIKPTRKWEIMEKEMRNHEDRLWDKYKGEYSSVLEKYKPNYPRKLKKKKEIVEELVAMFEPNVIYSEREINNTISRIFPGDQYCAIRKDMVGLGYMDRDPGRRVYWVRKYKEI